jgi:uncharacterized iron-regulated membrane protein
VSDRRAANASRTLPTLRTLVFWPHLIAGVSAGLVILLMSVTGVLLTYERQLIAWSDSAYRSTPPAGSTRLPLGTLLLKVRETNPNLVPTAVTMAADRQAPVTLAVRQRTVYVDAYSGQVLGEGNPTVRRAMTEIRSWHRWLSVEGDGRPVARFITGWSNLVFLFIVVSGFYLWFPRKWTWLHIRSVAFFNGKLRGKARDFNWHQVIGVWSLVPLFVIVASALPMSFPWANAALYRAVGEEPPRPGGAGREGGAAPNGAREMPESGEISPDAINALWIRAEAQEKGWTTITVRMPGSARAPLTFAIDRGNGGQPQVRSTLTVDRNGGVIRYETFADQKLGARLRSLSRFAHTGEVLGVTGQTIAGLASAGASVLVCTGLALAFRRLRAWLKRRTERQTPAAAESTAA